MAQALTERVSTFVLLIAVLAVLGGLVRLLLSHWTYVFLIIALVLAAVGVWHYAPHEREGSK
jgi:hypothetical protein